MASSVLTGDLPDPLSPSASTLFQRFGVSAFRRLRQFSFRRFGVSTFRRLFT